MKTSKRIFGIFLSVCVAASFVSALSMPAGADPTGSTYSIVIPSTLTVANSGWNSIGNISASGTLADGKKLTVSAASANNWALKSGENTVSYTLNNGSTEKGDAATSWEFTKEQLSTGATQAIGIDVADYSDKPAGTYTDTVTFTAKVEDAATVLAPALENGAKIKFKYQYNGRYSTYFEFTNNNGSYTRSPLEEDADEFNTTNLRVKADNPNVLILDVVCARGTRRLDSFCSTIEFDTTDNTFKFTNRGATSTNPPRKCDLISVSVNDTDVTDKLTDESTDKS